MEVQSGENVVVSIAAGATGLLLCHLLKKKGANIVALTSPQKTHLMKPFTTQVLDYRDRSNLETELKKVKFSKYFDGVG